jgi:hypothetical protein
MRSPREQDDYLEHGRFGEGEHAPPLTRAGLIRAIVAFAVAPLAVPATFYVNDLLFSRLPDPFGDYLALLIFAYPAELVFGLPAWFAFKHYRVTSILLHLAAGGLIGGLVALILRPHGYFALVFLLAASSSALLFRCISGSN